MKKIISLLLIVELAAGCAATEHSRPLSPGVERAEGSSGEEIAIGEKIHAQILSTLYVYTEPNMVAYLDKIGKSLAAFAQRQDLPYRFTLLYHDKIYATSAPGGFIYLTTGLINFLDNEAELAAVLAHEIGQLQYSDPRLSKSRKVLEEITRAGTMVAPAFGNIGALALLGLVMVNVMVENHIKTPEERLQEADRFALQFMVSAGYDPQGLIDVLYKFLNAGDDTIPYFYDYYQSRPITKERMQNVEVEFAGLPLEDKSFTTNQKDYLRTTKGVKEIYRA